MCIWPVGIKTGRQERRKKMTQPIYNQKTAEEVERKNEELQLREQTEKTREKTGEAVDAAGQQIKQSSRDAGRQAEQAVDERKNQLSSSIEDIGNAIDVAADRLYEKNHRDLADYGRKLSRGLHDASHALSSRSPGELLQDTSDLARRNPGIVIGGMFTLGLAASRFFKASQPPAQR